MIVNKGLNDTLEFTEGGSSVRSLSKAAPVAYDGHVH